MPNTYSVTGKSALGHSIEIRLLEDALAVDALSVPVLPLGRDTRIEWAASGQYGLGVMQARLLGTMLDDGSGLRGRLYDPPFVVEGYTLDVHADGALLFAGALDYDGEAEDLSNPSRVSEIAFKEHYGFDLDEASTQGRRRPLGWIEDSRTAETATHLGATTYLLHPWLPDAASHGQPHGDDLSWLDRIQLDDADYGGGEGVTWGRLLAEVGSRHLFTTGFSYTLGGIAAVYARAHSRAEQGGGFVVVDEDYRTASGGTVTLAAQEGVLYRHGQFETEVKGKGRIVDDGGDVILSVGTTRVRVTPRDDYVHKIAGDIHLHRTSGATVIVTWLDGTGLVGGAPGARSLESGMGSEIVAWRLGYKRRLRGCICRGFLDPMLPFTADTGDGSQLYRIVRCTWDLARGLTTHIEAVEIR